MWFTMPEKSAVKGGVTGMGNFRSESNIVKTWELSNSFFDFGNLYFGSKSFFLNARELTKQIHRGRLMEKR